SYWVRVKKSGGMETTPAVAPARAAETAGALITGGKRRPRWPRWTGVGLALQCPHPVVPGVVLDFRETQRLQQRRHVHAEAPAQALLHSVPATDGVVRRPAPGLDGPLDRWPLLIGAPKRHPVPVRLQHRVQIIDGSQLIAK